MSDWVSKEGTTYFWKLPFVTTVRELALGRRFARWYVVRKSLVQLAAVAAGLLAVSGILLAVNILLAFLNPWSALVLAYGVPVVLLVISFFSRLIVFGRVLSVLFYLVYGILVAISFMASLEVVQVASVALGVSVVSSLPEFLTTLLGTRLAMVLGSIALFTGSVISLGESELVGTARGGKVPLEVRLRVGIKRFYYGWLTFMPSVVSVILTPVMVRRLRVRIFHMYQSREQVQDAINKSGTSLGYDIDRDPELEKYIFGYFYKVSFVPPLVQIHVMGNQVVITWLKLPLTGRWGREAKRTFKKLSHILEKWEEAHYSGYSRTIIRLISLEKGEARFSFNFLHQAKHRARADYGHSLRMGVWSKPNQVSVRDYFYKLPWSLEGELGNQFITVKARRNIGEDESCTLQIRYEQTVKLKAVGDLYKIDAGFTLDGSYESTDETIELLLPTWCKLDKTTPSPQYRSEHQAMFVFQNCLPNSTSGIEALVRANENKEH